jgi:hypothetical protein
MRGTKAKRLRRAASAYVLEHRQRTSAMRCPIGGGVMHYLWGYRRIYKDMKRAVKDG